MSKPSAEAMSIADVVAAAQAGRLRIPPFQRRFRWDRSDMERLFDSVWNGYPIGSLLIWERRADEANLNIGPLAVSAPARDDAWFVVDGQQRVTSLAGVLGAPEDVTGDFELYFDLVEGQFQHRGRRTPPATWLPLRVALDTSSLLNWLLEFRSSGASDEHVKLATLLGQRLRDYKIPVALVRDVDESVLRDIFDRINNFGRRMNKAEVFHALHVAAGESAPHDLAGFGDEVTALGFGRLRDDTLLRALLASRGGDPFREFRNEFKQGEDPADTYASTVGALRRVIKFLQQDVAIPHVRLLPYVFVLPILVRFFAVFPQPSERSRVLLRRWVWRASVTRAGTGSQSTQLTRDLVRAIAKSEDESIRLLLQALDPVPPAPVDLGAFQLHRGAGRLNTALLSTFEPANLATGELIDVAALFDSDDEAGLPRLAVDSPPTDSIARILLHPPIRDDELADLVADASEAALRSQLLWPRPTEDELRSDQLSIVDRRKEALGGVLLERLLALAEPDASDRPAIAELVVSDDE